MIIRCGRNSANTSSVEFTAKSFFPSLQRFKKRIHGDECTYLIIIKLLSFQLNKLVKYNEVYLQPARAFLKNHFDQLMYSIHVHNRSCSTLKEEEDAVVDKLVTDVRDSIDPPFLRLDSEP